MESQQNPKEPQIEIANLAEWAASCSASSLCVNYQSSQNDFIRAIVLSEIRPIRFIADRQIAADVALCANEELVAVPPISISRGLRADLQGLLTGADGPVTVLPYTMMHDHVKARSKRLAQDMDIIAGYAPPSDIVIACVIADLRALLLQIAERGRSPLVVHDLLGVIPALPTPTITYFADPTAPPVPHRKAGIETAESRLGEDDQEEVSIDLIRTHAEFVADTAPADLRRMCPILAEPGSEPLRAYWLRNFERLADDEFSGWLKERAERVVKDAFGAA
ncbi:MAG: hypothetical protein AAF371_05690 [Pseudomonadota bacterium]